MRPQPIHLRFDAASHSPDERIRAWRQALGFSHDMIVRPEDMAAFEARFDGYHFGSIMLADMRASRHRAVRAKAQIARHAFDYIAVDFLVEGAISGRIGGRHVTVGPGDCFLLDICETMDIDVADHRCLTLIVPRGVFADRVGRIERLGGRLLPSYAPEARLLGGEMRNLLAVAPDLPEALAEAAGLACLDLVAACLAPHRLWDGPARDGLEPPRPQPAPTLARVERFVARNLARVDLGPALLCTEFGLSRTALYHLARPAGGVAALVRRHRTAEAHRLLTSAGAQDLAIDEVSRRCGFGNVRTLRRTLSDAYGSAPRSLHAAGAQNPGAQDTPLDTVDLRTSAWIDAV